MTLIKNNFLRFKKVPLRVLCIMLLIPILLGCLSGCAKAEQQVKTLEELKSGRVGVVTGSAYEQLAKETFDNAEFKYFTGGSEMILGLEQDKIEVFLADSLWYAAMRWDLDTLERYDESIESLDCAFALSDKAVDAGLMEELNAFIAESKEN
jgi:ABC-type amino acid transport substrate-binding protein